MPQIEFREVGSNGQLIQCMDIRQRADRAFKQFIFAMALGDYKAAKVADEEIERLMELGAPSPFARVQDN